MRSALVTMAMSVALTVGSLGGLGAEDGDHVSERNGIRVVHAWARATTDTTGTVFMDVASLGPADRLIGAQTPVARGVTIEGVLLAEGEITARTLPEIEIPAGGELVLEPDVLFLRLSGLEHALVEGDEFPLTLTFGTAGELPVTALVEAPDATRHSHAGHEH